MKNLEKIYYSFYKIIKHQYNSFFICDNNNVSWAANPHIRMISGSCDTED